MLTDLYPINTQNNVHQLNFWCFVTNKLKTDLQTYPTINRLIITGLEREEKKHFIDPGDHCTCQSQLITELTQIQLISIWWIYGLVVKCSIKTRVEPT